MIVHFASKEEWDAAKESGAYAPAGLEEHGFVHCSFPSQAAQVANERFSGRDDIVLLWIDPSKLRAAIIYERRKGEEIGDLWPHVYGPIGLEAVTAAQKLRGWQPGKFVLPREPSTGAASA